MTVRWKCLKVLLAATTLCIAAQKVTRVASADCDLTTKFLCADDKRCIPKSYICNGEFDCPGREDEDDCGIAKCDNEENLFKCRSGQCISVKEICDDEPDCRDASDESSEMCDKIRSRRNDTDVMIYKKLTCDAKTEFACNDYACIPIGDVCNGAKNCADGRDEDKKLCADAKFKCSGFKCRDGKCLERHEFTCDGVKDCEDGSDEEHCSRDCLLTDKKFLCKSGEQCLDISQVCNGKEDCPDKSDEGGRCNEKDGCEKLGCKGSCVLLPSGPKCMCGKGFKFNQISDQCEDIDECLVLGTCSQGCVNTNGSYRCTCEKGFLLNSDGKSCDTTSSDVSLVYTTRKSIKKVSIGQRNKYFNSLVQKAKQPVGVAFDGESYYWTEVEINKEVIVKFSTERGAKKQILLTNGLELPEYLVVDWLTKNIYFTDSSRKHIAVCDNGGYFCTELVKNNIISSPRAIAIHPIESLLFWSDWGVHAHIGVSFMDGSQSKVLIDDVAWPNGLTLDWPNGRIYWVDAKLLKIESSTITGQDRRVILDGVFKHPFALAVHGNTLYWCDQEKKSIEYCDKFTGKNHDTLIQGDDIFDVHVFDKSAMPQIKHACIDHDCSHICLLSSNNSYTCACPMDMELSGDEHSCRFSKEAYTVIFGIGSYLTIKPYQVFGRNSDVEPKLMSNWFDRMEYNPQNGDIFFADNHKHVMSVVDSQGREHTLVKDDFLLVSSMSFDYLANNLYWANEQEGTIEVLSLTTKKRATLYHYKGTFKPNAIIVVPSIGEMFVAVVSSDHSRIDRHSIKGEMFDDRYSQVIDRGLSRIGPFHFAIDEKEQRLYWSDGANRRIEFSKFNGSERYLFVIPEREPGPIAIVGEYLHWASKKSDSLRWRNKTGKGPVKSSEITIPKTFSKKDYPDIVQILSGSPLKISRHPCMNNNGGCSDICISDGPATRVCQCATGFDFIDRQNMTCVVQNRCEFRCKSGECFEAAKKCDGTPNCRDGSDEEKQMCGVKNNCLLDEFKCDSGQCIPKKLKCDKNNNCMDKSDEKYCSDEEVNFKCKNDKIQCPNTQTCIFTTQICDKTQDCPDGFDETEENCNRKCHDTEFKCSSGQCVPKEFECNREIDCVDGSDEHSGCVPICKAPKKACRDGHCIPEKLFCDGIEDCQDGFDEKNCENVTIANPCDFSEFQCKSSPEKCISRSEVCDGKKDCPRGEDERKCDCPRHMFECDNGQCILAMYSCDGVSHCRDHSDEKECQNPNVNSQINAVMCSKDTYRCSDGTCLDYTSVCDGIKDCDDDEGDTCKMACTAKKKCNQICHKTPKGSVCACNEGYQLKAKGELVCTDIDECLSFPCSQKCENTDGSFECDCFEGYVRTANKVDCKARGKAHKLIYLLPDQVRMITESTQVDHDVLFDAEMPLGDIAVDTREGKLIVSAESAAEMVTVGINNGSIIMRYTHFPEVRSMTYDWITKNVYIVNKPGRERFEIHVCNLESEKCVMLKRLTKFTEIIPAIDIDPINNYVFYVKTVMSFFANVKSSEIVRMRLDGTDEKSIFSEDSHTLLTALAVDVDRKAVFFTEVSSQSLQAINYEGERIKTFAHQSKMLQRSMALSVFENHAYVLDERNARIAKCKVFGDNKCDTLDIDTGKSKRFLISHVVKQPLRENFCESHQCSEICINADMGVKCLCSVDKGVTEAVPCPEIQVKANTDVSQQSRSNRSSTASVWLYLIMLVLLLSGVVGYYVYKKKGFHHNWNINIHFDGNDAPVVTEFEPNLKERPIAKERSTNAFLPYVTVTSPEHNELVTSNALPVDHSKTTTEIVAEFDVPLNDEDDCDRSRLIQ